MSGCQLSPTANSMPQCQLQRKEPLYVVYVAVCCCRCVAVGAPRTQCGVHLGMASPYDWPCFWDQAQHMCFACTRLLQTAFFSASLAQGCWKCTLRQVSQSISLVWWPYLFKHWPDGKQQPVEAVVGCGLATLHYTRPSGYLCLPTCGLHWEGSAHPWSPTVTLIIPHPSI